MPKPVKKPAKKTTKGPRRADRFIQPADGVVLVSRAAPSSDPMVRARQLMAEHMEKAEGTENRMDRFIGQADDIKLISRAADTPAAPLDFQAQYKAHMAKLGAKGGKVSGAKRMEMPEKQRKAIATKAARARWAKPRV